MYHVYWSAAQSNISKAEGRTTELKGKLEHERAKFKQHEKDLEAAEKKFVSADKAHSAVVKVRWWGSVIARNGHLDGPGGVSQQHEGLRNAEPPDTHTRLPLQLRQALEAATEAFKEMERRDAQNNENVKAIKIKIKKITDKMASDTQSFAVRRQIVSHTWHVFTTGARRHRRMIYRHHAHDSLLVYGTLTATGEGQDRVRGGGSQAGGPGAAADGGGGCHRGGAGGGQGCRQGRGGGAPPAAGAGAAGRGGVGWCRPAGG